LSRAAPPRKLTTVAMIKTPSRPRPTRSVQTARLAFDRLVTARRVQFRQCVASGLATFCTM
jgi:hypothetical protein